ncbi:type II secretion system F family protein [Halopseudomonas sp.]|uniref:type II secretion system F family protein n=1 Tax=Halopseudomonas sp. TaxID=2901191 RepID=UPI003001522B
MAQQAAIKRKAAPAKRKAAGKEIQPSTFKWEGKDRKGTKVAGEMQSTNAALVKAQLRKQGVLVTKVNKKSMLFASKGKKIKPLDVAFFTRQLATMMKSGVPIIQAFDIIAEGTANPNFQKLINEIKVDVAAGNTLADSLRQHPKYFDDLFCNLVESGEQSGRLESLLDRIATYKEKTEALKAKIKKAMTYPIAVVVVAIVVTAILLLKVVPQFKEVFANFGAELPAFTLMVINLSEWLQSWWFIILIGFIAIGYAYTQAHFRSKKFRDAQDRLLLKAPIVGDIIYKAAVARYARTLSTTFAAGVPLVDALDSVAGAAGNVVFYNAVMQIKEDVSAGSQLNFSMRTTNVFPSLAIQMAGIGEESGNLDGMLDKVADYYEAEVDNAVDNLTTLMEPMIMVVLGVLVGGLIIAMYLPIFQLGAVV